MSAAAVAIVATGVIAVARVANSSPRRVRPSVDQSVVHYLPNWWPPQLDGSIQTSGDSDSVISTTSWVLTKDRVAVAVAIVEPLPLGTTDTTVEGRAATWTSDNGVTSLSVRLLPGRYLAITSRTLDHSAISELVDAFDPTTGEPTASLLPPGWQSARDPAQLGSFAVGNGRMVASRAIRSTSAEDSPALQLAVATVPDADAALTTIRQLMGAQARSTEITAGQSAVEVPEDNSPTDVGLVFALSKTAIAVVGPTGFTPGSPSPFTLDQLTHVARSVRPVSEDTWAAQEQPDEKTVTVDGFVLRRDEVPVQHGTTGSYRWMVTTEPMTALPQAAPTSQLDAPSLLVVLHVIPPSGEQYWGGSSVGVGGRGVARGTDVATVEIGAPLGLTVTSFTVDGTVANPVSVQLPNLNVTYVFAMFDAATTPDLSDSEVHVTGTLPDGASWSSSDGPGPHN